MAIENKLADIHDQPFDPNHQLFTKDSIIQAISHLPIKTPGIYNISMCHYKWACNFYGNILSFLFRIFVKHNHIPLKTKLNINIALPKYDHSATLDTKQNPSKYLTILIYDCFHI